ncbi:TPA: hypothetical protein ACH3X2_010918 [Trebouxia sp. C0005]
MAVASQDVTLKRGSEVLLKFRAGTKVDSIVQQLAAVCPGARIEDTEGFAVALGYPRNLMQEEYTVIDPTPAGEQDDKLSKVLANTEQLKAILPALTLMANPFQSASSLTSKEAQLQASDFKSRVFKYYFSPPPPPELQHLPSQAYFAGGKMTCMVSKLSLSSNLVEAAHILPKASAQWGNCALGVSDVWDERNGLLWAEPFEKAYHALEIVVMFQPGDGTFKFQVLIESLMNKKLSAYAKSEPARLCPELQQHTFGEYDNTDLLMPSGNVPFRRTLAAHAAISVTAQQHRLRSSLSFTAKDFDIVSDYDEKGTTAAWVQTSLATAITSHAVT